MNKNVSLPVVLLAIIALAALLYGLYRITYNTKPPEHPGASDIPPKRPGDEKPAVPPPEAGPVPNMIKR